MIFQCHRAVRPVMYVIEDTFSLVRVDPSSLLQSSFNRSNLFMWRSYHMELCSMMEIKLMIRIELLK